MESWYFITFSLLVAFVAVGGAAYGIGLRGNAKGDSPAITGKDTTKPFKPMLTSYDVEARLRAIDTLDEAMSKLQPLAQIGQNDLLNNIERYIMSGEATGKLLNWGIKQRLPGTTSTLALAIINEIPGYRPDDL